MGDENLNNNEETAALFVSAQKKKKAEEEARKKAEAEQAKRDAAEAEVRKMEQEVEERRRQMEEERKAEEERLAAEAAAKNPAHVIKEEIKGKAGNVVNKSAGSKVPLFAGIGAAVVAVILIAVFALGGKGKTIDYENINCSGEYKSKEDGFENIIYYPSDIYDQVTEEYQEKDSVKGVTVQFASKSYKAPDIAAMSVYSDDLTTQDLALACEEANSMLKEFVTALMEGYQPQQEEISDLAAQKPGEYYYKCTYQSDEMNGAVAAWIEPGSSGKAMIMVANISQKGAEIKNLVALRDAYYAKNSSDASKIPGGNPPVSYDWDGEIQYAIMNMKMPVPKDRFKEATKWGDDAGIWYDDNGAIIAILSEELAPIGEIEVTDEIAQGLYEVFADSAKTELADVLSPTNRLFLTDKNEPYDHIDYSAEFRDTINGIQYWERDYYVLWRGKENVYTAIICTYVPEANKEVYKDIFDKSLKELAEIQKTQ